MPTRWLQKPDGDPGNTGSFSYAAGDPPGWHLQLWPHQSLTPQGFVVFFGITIGLIAIPVVPMIGSPALLFILLPFGLTLTMLWYSLKRSWSDRRITEEVRLWSDRIVVRRRDPGGMERSWEANPYWVRVSLHVEDGPIPNYLTLSGEGREIEVGAFLSEDERLELRHDLERMLLLVPKGSV
ncbi:MAG: DUF2244 domain-containing protein [Pseudomonadota bacterium]